MNNFERKRVMKVFYSWSGARSHKVAELLSTWVSCVIQSVDPFISSKDIDRGAVWFNEISSHLNNAQLGIVCLTAENKDKPWILFEAGALANGLSDNKVCTFLVDLVPTDLENPLAQFNHTLPIKESVYALLHTINKSLEEHMLKEAILQRSFDTFWPQFETDFAHIISSTPAATKVKKRDDGDILLEVLTTVRELGKDVSKSKYVIERSTELEDDKSSYQKLTTQLLIVQGKLIYIHRENKIYLDDKLDEFKSDLRLYINRQSFLIGELDRIKSKHDYYDFGPHLKAYDKTDDIVNFYLKD